MQKLSVQTLLVVAIALLGLNAFLMWNKPIVAGAQGKKWSDVQRGEISDSNLLGRGYEPFAVAWHGGGYTMFYRK